MIRGRVAISVTMSERSLLWSGSSFPRSRNAPNLSVKYPTALACRITGGRSMLSAVSIANMSCLLPLPPECAPQATKSS